MTKKYAQILLDTGDESRRGKNCSKVCFPFIAKSSVTLIPWEKMQKSGGNDLRGHMPHLALQMSVSQFVGLQAPCPI